MNVDNQYAAAAIPREAGPLDTAERVLSDASQIYSMLDELSTRLFGPEPREVGNTSGSKSADPSRPSLAHMLRDGGVATSCAIGRLSTILARI